MFLIKKNYKIFIKIYFLFSTYFDRTSSQKYVGGPPPPQISTLKKIGLGEGDLFLKVREGDKESVMCDVIRIRLIRKDER